MKAISGGALGTQTAACAHHYPGEVDKHGLLTIAPDELVEMMTWAQLDRHRKPILVANINGFWDPLTALFERMTEAGFLTKAFLANRVVLPVRFVDTIEEVIPTIRAALAAVPEGQLAGEAPGHG